MREQTKFDLAWQHAAMLGVSVLLVLFGAWHLRADLIAGTPPTGKALGPLILGGVVLVADCFVFGFRSFARRVVAAGLVLGAISIGGGILGLTLGVTPLASPMSRGEALVWLLAGLALLAVAGVLKAIFFASAKFEDMTTKGEAPTRPWTATK